MVASHRRAVAPRGDFQVFPLVRGMMASRPARRAEAPRGARRGPSQPCDSREGGQGLEASSFAAIAVSNSVDTAAKVMPTGLFFLWALPLGAASAPSAAFPAAVVVVVAAASEAAVGAAADAIVVVVTAPAVVVVDAEPAAVDVAVVDV